MAFFGLIQHCYYMSTLLTGACGGTVSLDCLASERENWIVEQNMIILFDNLIEGRNLGVARLLLKPQKASNGIWGKGASLAPRFPIERA